MSRSKKDLLALEYVQKTALFKGEFEVHRYYYNKESFRWACKKLCREGFLKRVYGGDKKYLRYELVRRAGYDI